MEQFSVFIGVYLCFNGLLARPIVTSFTLKSHTMPEQKKIGRYIVESLLGEGAMGSVFKATDPFIKRIVAIKIVKLDATTNEKERKEFLDRFKQEAEISGHLSRPHIVAIYGTKISKIECFKWIIRSTI